MDYQLAVSLTHAFKQWSAAKGPGLNKAGIQRSLLESTWKSCKRSKSLGHGGTHEKKQSVKSTHFSDTTSCAVMARGVGANGDGACMEKKAEVRMSCAREKA